MKRIWLTAMLSLAVWLAPSARAELVSQDYLAPGDGLLTLDSQTGLRWLDVSATQGLGANQILAGAGGWNSHFRYATYAELSALFEHAGLPTSPGGKVAVSPDPAMYSAASAFNALIDTAGAGASPISQTDGFYPTTGSSIGFLRVHASQDASSTFATYSYIESPPGEKSAPSAGGGVGDKTAPSAGGGVGDKTASGGGAGGKGWSYDTYSPKTGSMLVLAVPEPQTWALLLAGLGMLAGVARRRAA